MAGEDYNMKRSGALFLIWCFLLSILVSVNIVGQNPPPPPSTGDDEEEDFSTSTTEKRDKFQNALIQAIQGIKDLLQKELGIGAKKEQKKQEDPNAKKNDNKKAKKNLAKKIKKAPRQVGRGVLPSAPATPVIARPKPTPTQPQSTGQNDIENPPPTPGSPSTGSSSSPLGSPSTGGQNRNDIINKLKEALGKKTSSTGSKTDKEEEEFKKEEERRKLLIQIYKETQEKANRALKLCAEKMGGNPPKCENDTGAKECQKISKEPLCRELCYRCGEFAEALDNITGKSGGTTPDQKLEELALPEADFARILHIIEEIENKFAEISPEIGNVLALYKRFDKIYNGLKANTCSEEIKMEFLGTRDPQTIYNYLARLREEVISAAKKANIYKYDPSKKKENLQYFYNGENITKEIHPLDYGSFVGILNSSSSNCLKEIVSGGTAPVGTGQVAACTQEYKNLLTSPYNIYNEFLNMFALYSLLCQTQKENLGKPIQLSWEEVVTKSGNRIETINAWIKETSPIKRSAGETFKQYGLPILLYTVAVKEYNPALYGTLSQLYSQFQNGGMCHNILWKENAIGNNLNNKILSRATLGTGIEGGNIAWWELKGDSTIEVVKGQQKNITNIISSSEGFGGSYFKTILQKDLEDSIVSQFKNYHTTFCNQFGNRVMKQLKGVAQFDISAGYLKNTLGECINDAVNPGAQPEAKCCDSVIAPVLKNFFDKTQFENFKEQTGYTIFEKKWERYLSTTQGFYDGLVDGLIRYIKNKNEMEEDCKKVHGTDCNPEKYTLCSYLLFAMVAKDGAFATNVAGSVFGGFDYTLGTPIPKPEHYIKIALSYAQTRAKWDKILKWGDTVTDKDVKWPLTEEEPKKPLWKWDSVKNMLGLGYIARDAGATFLKNLSCKALLNSSLTIVQSGSDGTTKWYGIENIRFPDVTIGDGTITLSPDAREYADLNPNPNPSAPPNSVETLFNSFYTTYFKKGGSGFLDSVNVDNIKTLISSLPLEWSGKVKWEDSEWNAAKLDRVSPPPNCGTKVTDPDTRKEATLTCFLCANKNSKINDVEWKLIKTLLLKGFTKQEGDKQCLEISDKELQQPAKDIVQIPTTSIDTLTIWNAYFDKYIKIGNISKKDYPPHDNTFGIVAQIFFFGDWQNWQEKVTEIKSTTLYSYLTGVYEVNVNDNTPINIIHTSILNKNDTPNLLCAIKTTTKTTTKSVESENTPQTCSWNIYYNNDNSYKDAYTIPLPSSESESFLPSEPSIKLENLYYGLQILLKPNTTYKQTQTTGGTTTTTINLYWYKTDKNGVIQYNDNTSLYKNLYKACTGEDPQ